MSIASLSLFIIFLVETLAVFILAGGKSTRMGRDKALLQWQGTTLLERALATARQVANDVTILGPADRFARYGPVLEDTYRAAGPLGGIHAALLHSAKHLHLILAVDLVFLPSSFLSFMIAQARQQNSMVTVPRCDGRLQPLCALFRQPFSAIAAQALLSGQHKVTSLFPAHDTHIVGEERIVQAGFSPEIFRNVNTEEDWLEAKRRLGQERLS